MRTFCRSLPVMAGCLLSLLAPVTAQVSPRSPELATIQPRPAPPSLLSAFHVMAATVQDVMPERDPSGDQLVQVVLGGQVRHLVLSQFEVRAPGFKLFVNDGISMTEVAPPPCVTYRGIVLEDPNAVVSATIENGSVTAQVLLPNATWIVQPVREVVPSAGARAHIVFQAADNQNLPYTCGQNGVAPTISIPPTGLDVLYTAEIACEADPQFFQANGSNVNSTQNDITSIINGVSTIYTRDVEVVLQITQIVVTTSGSTYSTNDPASLLNQFNSNWNANNGSIQRDVAHLFTGRNLSGSVIGIATLGSVCGGSAYGLSQSRFSSNFNRRVGLTAHELGHNFGSSHCDGSSPCYIMCSGLGGCNNSVTQFGSAAAGQIINFRNNASCLSFVQSQPNITSLSPTSVSVYWPAVMSLTGSGFLGTSTIRVGGVAVAPNAFTVLNDNEIRLTLPNGTALGAETVSVTNSAGTSNTAGFLYTETTPCKLQGTGGVYGGQNANFQFAGRLNHAWFLLLGFSNATSPLQGFPVLVSPMLLAAGTLDGVVGAGTFSINVPPGLTAPLIVNTQLLEIGPNTTQLTSTSNIPFTVLLP